MGSPPLYPSYDDDGPVGSHPTPPPKPTTPHAPGPNDTTLGHESPSEKTVAGQIAARPSGVDDLLAVMASLGDQLESFKAMRAHHEAEAARLNQLHATLAEREAALTKQEASHAEQRAKLAAAHAAIKAERERQSALTASLNEREQQLNAREAQAQQLCEQTRGLAQQAESDQHALEHALRHASERESIARALQAAAAEHINTAAIAAADRMNARAWREQAEASRADAEATRAEWQRLEHQSRAAREELDATRRDLTGKLEASRQGEQASMAEWERLSEETASLRKRLAAAEKDAESLRAAAQAPAPAAPDTQATDALRAKLAEAITRAEHAEAALKKRPEPAPAAPTSAAPADWERQLRKRDQAIRALKEHLEAAEAKALERDQLFKMREQVLAERDRVKAMAVVAQRKSARYSAAVATLLLAVALLLSAAGSWWAAGHFSPATYLAEATIAPDHREGTLRASHAESWTLYHRNLFEDPVFIERAAERLAARGFADMGTPAALRDSIRARVRITDAADHGLLISLKGIGATPTQRALDILVTTLANQANAARDLRLDRTSTIIAAASSAGDRPIEDPRATVFGVIFGGLAAVVLIAFTLLSRWLARAPIAAGEQVIDLNESTHGYNEAATALGADPDATRTPADDTRP